MTETVSVQALVERFGEAQAVAPWGKCIIVPSDKFEQSWRSDLAGLGLVCHSWYWNGAAVVFVQLKRAVPQGKTVYVPPVVPVVHSNSVVTEVKKMVETKTLKMPHWSLDEDAYIKELYNSGKLTDKIAELVHAKYPVRNAPGILKHLQKLQQTGFLEYRMVKGKAKVPPLDKISEVKVTAPVMQAFEVQSLKVAALEQSIAVLQEAFSALSKLAIDTRKQSSALMDKIGEASSLYATTTYVDECCGELRRGLEKHKHAQGSGEAMLPMEASS